MTKHCAEQFQTQLGATACVPCHAHSSTAGAAGSDAAEGRFCPGRQVATVCRLFSHSPPGASQDGSVSRRAWGCAWCPCLQRQGS